MATGTKVGMVGGVGVGAVAAVVMVMAVVAAVVLQQRNMKRKPLHFVMKSL